MLMKLSLVLSDPKILQNCTITQQTLNYIFHVSKTALYTTALLGENKTKRRKEVWQ